MLGGSWVENLSNSTVKVAKGKGMMIIKPVTEMTELKLL